MNLLQMVQRIAILENEKAEACAAAQGFRLALDEANAQIEHLTTLHANDIAKKDKRG